MGWGDGRVYQPRKGAKRLDVWYYDIFLGGRRKTRRGFRTKRAADEALKAERKRKARGEFIPAEVEVLRVETLLDRYLADLKDRAKKSIASMSYRIELLKTALGSIRAL